MQGEAAGFGSLSEGRSWALGLWGRRAEVGEGRDTWGDVGNCGTVIFKARVDLDNEKRQRGLDPCAFEGLDLLAREGQVPTCAPEGRH